MTPLSQYTLLLLNIFLMFNANAQSGKMPPFRMMQANGKVFKAENLPMGKPIIIYYFSPDCDHCQHFTQEMVKKKSALQKASVVMVSYFPVQEVMQFARKYGTDKLSNFYIGTEGNSFFLRNYYQLTQIPFLALYDKMGNLKKTYQRNIDINNLLQNLKPL